MQRGEVYADNAAHLVHMGGVCFPCDREIEAIAAWRGHTLLLSSDTDCLSLWDGAGLIRTARAGVYPQDAAVSADTAFVCGGADGRVHLFALPELTELAAYPVPGMPERICVQGDAAYLLTLLPDARTVLLRVDANTGAWAELERFGGIPGALAADDGGLWLGLSELVCRMPWQGDALFFEGFGLPRQIIPQGDGVLISDPVQGFVVHAAEKPRPAVHVLYRGEVGDFVFL